MVLEPPPTGEGSDADRPPNRARFLVQIALGAFAGLVVGVATTTQYFTIGVWSGIIGLAAVAGVVAFARSRRLSGVAIGLAAVYMIVLVSTAGACVGFREVRLY